MKKALIRLLLIVAFSSSAQNVSSGLQKTYWGPAQECVKFLKWYFANQQRLKSSYNFTDSFDVANGNAQVNFKEVNSYVADISSSGYASAELLQHITNCFKIVADSLKSEVKLEKITLPPYAAEPIIANADAERYLKKHIDQLKIIRSEWDDELNVYWLSVYAGDGLRVNFNLTDRTGKWQISSCYVWSKEKKFNAHYLAKLRVITDSYPAKFVDKPAYHIVINRNDNTPGGVCVNFLKWYIKNERALNYKYETVNVHGFDSTKIYTVDYKQVKGLVSEFKRSGFVSDVYLNHIYDVYKQAENEIKSNHINDGPVEVLKADMVMQDMESGLRPVVNDLKVVSTYKDGETWRVKLKAAKTLFYTCAVKRYGTQYLIDKEQVAWK